MIPDSRALGTLAQLLTPQQVRRWVVAAPTTKSAKEEQEVKAKSTPCFSELAPV